MTFVCKILNKFKQPTALPEVTDPNKIDIDYKYWRIRIFYSMYIGYAVYYFTRKSFTFAIPNISSDLHLDKGSLGWIGSVLAISYGISKFVSGILSDQANARYFMACGLIATGILNILFGLSSYFWLFVLFWALNGWFQGFGWPPCAKFLSYWYSQSERGRWWGVWNTSHNLGGAIIPIIIVFLSNLFGWRYAMMLNGIFAILIGIWLANRLRDTPESLGLPTIEKYKNEEKNNIIDLNNDKSFKEIFFKYIFKNKYIWILACAYFFVYIVRIVMNDWTMPYLIEKKGYTNSTTAGFVIAAFEIGGFFGSIVAGWLSDVIFKGGRGFVNCLFAFLMAICIVFFWQVSAGKIWLDTILVGAIGFFVFGPQMLIGIAAVELSHKKAAATSTGFIGWIGYLGAFVAGGPVGMILDKFGWESFFITLITCSSISIFFLAFLIKAKAYQEKQE
ncbi:phosphoglycerate transporter protein PgtP [Pigmentibacter sp. JX0631]|uniref:phosphoglycerate transporter protein PgtP n=1 Tax=Pigmentibacter sp. JX0631 TaxID=2976982 RepID=UPI0024698F46|nr:phosphoglycerate transporter protein PgtP [Pigmentibacter sp. JX0631]WGL59281.1 phosphoglycerate transporter protein PgtP [Pigmentibacter sp. JX0631]